MTRLLSRDELEAELRAIGERQYHDLHPFHKMLHGGELDPLVHQREIPRGAHHRSEGADGRNRRWTYRHALHHGWRQGHGRNSGHRSLCVRGICAARRYGGQWRWRRSM